MAPCRRASVPLALALALGLSQAGPAAAQDTVRTPVEDTVLEFEQVRAKQVRQVQSAPSRAMHGWRGTDVDFGAGVPEPEALPPPRSPFEPDDGPGWKTLVSATLLLLVGFGFWHSRRAAQR